MSIYLSFFLYKENCRIPCPSRCLLTGSWNFSQRSFRYRAFFEHGFSVLDIKPLMIATNLTLGEVIWLLFELASIVIRTRTDKTAVTYIEIELYKHDFKCRFI